MPQIKMLAGLALSERCEEESVPSLSSSAWWFTGNHAHSFASASSPQSLPSSSHDGLHVCICCGHWLGAQCSTVICNLLFLAHVLLQRLRKPELPNFSASFAVRGWLCDLVPANEM